MVFKKIITKLVDLGPIALKQVVDHMTDAFLIIDDKYRVVDYNKAFIGTLGKGHTIERNTNITDVLSKTWHKRKDIDMFKDYIDRAINKGDTLVFRKCIEKENKNIYLDIEITPIYSNTKHIGTILFFKDITAHIENMQTIRDYQALLEKNLEQITQDKQDLLVRNAIIEKMMHTDALTDMYNHRTFHEYMDMILEQIKNTNINMQLALIDIDDFKKINDTFGHSVGDIVLKRIASKIKEMVTVNDIPARYGGEEFAIIFISKTIDETYKIVELSRKVVQREKYREIDRPVTISIGICDYKPGYTKEILFDKADKAMYKAKNSGKNQTVIAD